MGKNAPRQGSQGDRHAVCANCGGGCVVHIFFFRAPWRAWSYVCTWDAEWITAGKQTSQELHEEDSLALYTRTGGGLLYRTNIQPHSGARPAARQINRHEFFIILPKAHPHLQNSPLCRTIVEMEIVKHSSTKATQEEGRKPGARQRDGPLEGSGGKAGCKISTQRSFSELSEREEDKK